MKQSRFTEERIIAVLREQEAGSKTGDVCRKHGISSATFYKWKAKYGGLDVSEARRLKVLIDENAKLKKLLGRRFGYRRLLPMLRGEGILINHKKLRRLYAEERLQVRRRGGRKRALGTRAPLTVPQGPNQRWSLDFVSDTLTDSRRFLILAVVDDFTRECI